MSLAADTSVLVAATVAEHEHHTAAHRSLRDVTHLPAPCLAETWSVLTRAFGLDPETVGRIVGALARSDRQLFAASTADFAAVFRTASALGIRGDVHDAVIWQACQSAGVDLVTLDRRWVQRAGQPDRCRYLLAES